MMATETFPEKTKRFFSSNSTHFFHACRKNKLWKYLICPYKQFIIEVQVFTAVHHSSTVIYILFSDQQLIKILCFFSWDVTILVIVLVK